jgi:hypothetical protein
MRREDGALQGLAVRDRASVLHVPFIILQPMNRQIRVKTRAAYA